MTDLSSPSSSSSCIPPECLEDPEVDFVPSNLPVWPRKTLKYTGSDIGIHFDTHRT